MEDTIIQCVASESRYTIKIVKLGKIYINARYLKDGGNITELRVSVSFILNEFENDYVSITVLKSASQNNMFIMKTVGNPGLSINQQQARFIVDLIQ